MIPKLAAPMRGLEQLRHRTPQQCTPAAVDSTPPPLLALLRIARILGDSPPQSNALLCFVGFWDLECGLPTSSVELLTSFIVATTLDGLCMVGYVAAI
jgi:hypothetical protein